VYTLKISNSTGYELPSSGGIGTTIFYVLGSLLVLGCGIVLVARRRMHIHK
jgi:LPXTG-motif cell wall-anchored protein